MKPWHAVTICAAVGLVLFGLIPLVPKKRPPACRDLRWTPADCVAACADVGAVCKCASVGAVEGR